MLRARLVPPAAPPRCLARPRLAERAAEALRAGVPVSIAAGPGWGKTTLLVQALEAAGGPWAWLACDERMRAPETLVAHLAAALDRAVPGLGRDIDAPAAPLAAAGELCARLGEEAPPGLVLALDDVGALTGHPGGELVRALARDLPPGLALALAGRGAPPIALARLRASGAVLELGPAELAFSEEEGAELVGALAPDPLPAPAPAELAEGWPAGLALIARAAASGVAPDQLVFEYLDEELFQPQSQAARDFLLETALLDRLTPHSAGALTGRVDAGAILERLVRDGMLTVRLPGTDERYRYHGLLRAFLQRRLAASRSRRTQELHRRAGALWLRAGEPRQAVGHLLEAGASGAAADALAAVAEDLVADGSLAALAGWLERLGPALTSSRPGLVLAAALLAAERDAPPLAAAALARAVDDLIGIGEPERAARAVGRLATLGAEGGDREEAIELARAALARLEPAASATLPAARIGLAALLGSAGRHAEAEAEVSAALALPAAVGARGLEAAAMVVQGLFIDHPQGRSEAALEVLAGAVDDGPAARRAVPGLPSPRVSRALVLNRLGRHEEALAEVGRTAGRAASPAAGSATWERLEALSALGRWGALRTELARAESGQGAPPATGWGHRYHVARARLAAQEGDPVAVAAHVERARERVRTDGSPLEAALTFVDLALAAGAVGAAPIARAMAERARSEAEAAGVPLAIARAARAVSAVAAGRPAGPRRAAAPGRVLRPSIRLVTLGRFEVLRGADALAGVRFDRRKAPAVLMALACAGEPLHREVLQEWFWPDLPPARGLSALHTTLHALRRALGLGRGAAGSPLVSEGQTYQLRLAATDSWDAAEFLDLAEEAAAPAEPAIRIVRLRAAEDAHAGRFLPDWPDAVWSRAWHVRLDDAYQATLERLGDALLAAGRAPEAIERFRRLVAIDPDREGWHRGLMRSLAAVGQTKLALRQYEVCRLHLRRAHGAEPGRETRELRRTLVAVRGPGRPVTAGGL